MIWFPLSCLLLVNLPSSTLRKWRITLSAPMAVKICTSWMLMISRKRSTGRMIPWCMVAIAGGMGGGMAGAIVGGILGGILGGITRVGSNLGGIGRAGTIIDCTTGDVMAGIARPCGITRAGDIAGGILGGIIGFGRRRAFRRSSWYSSFFISSHRMTGLL